MAKAIGYARVSTDAQGESGLGLEAQHASVAVAARRLGLELAELHEDAGLSGSLGLENRPGLLAAVSALRRGDVMLVAKRDRIGRDVVAVAMIERLVERKGARIVSAAGEGTESNEPTALLMRRIVDAFAEYERALIATRTKLALRAKRSRGQLAGGVPFGHSVGEDGRTLVPVAAELEVLAWVRGRREAGASYREIAAELTNRSVPTKKGGKWHPETVRSVLEHARTA
jgi:DNA invertase Pin-like site-specific DNA recombinase